MTNGYITPRSPFLGLDTNALKAQLHLLNESKAEKMYVVGNKAFDDGYSSLYRSDKENDRIQAQVLKLVGYIFEYDYQKDPEIQAELKDLTKHYDLKYFLIDSDKGLKLKDKPALVAKIALIASHANPSFLESIQESTDDELRISKELDLVLDKANPKEKLEYLYQLRIKSNSPATWEVIDFNILQLASELDVIVGFQNKKIVVTDRVWDMIERLGTREKIRVQDKIIQAENSSIPPHSSCFGNKCQNFLVALELFLERKENEKGIDSGIDTDRDTDSDKSDTENDSGILSDSDSSSSSIDSLFLFNPSSESKIDP